MSPREPAGPWPALPWSDWGPTVATLHMWLQIIGKMSLTLAPPLNHWWHSTLLLSSRGLTTTPMPFGSRFLQIDLDFIDHRLAVTVSDGARLDVNLEPKSVAAFYRELREGLSALGMDVAINTRPVEVTEAIPFESDEQHASYDPQHAHALWQALLRATGVMRTFQSRFVGKASPVQLYWGSFDLAASRYSGRPAPPHPGGAPNCPPWVMVEAYSREEHAIGWWPSSDDPGPAFYAYSYPEPEGLRAAAIGPAAAYFDDALGEFILPYDAVRGADDPDALILEFFESTYAAGADLAGWDRGHLEARELPDRPPVRPWSTVDAPGS